MLQPDHELENVKSGEVYSTYKLPDYDLRLKQGDIISIRVGSIDQSDLDFIYKYAYEMGEYLYLKDPSSNRVNNQQVPLTPNGGIIKGPTQYDKALGFKLSENGSVELPKLGKVGLDGMTITEAEKLIEDKLKDGYLDNPIVRVQILNFRFTVVGEIKSPGVYTTYKPKTTLFEALSFAGNFDEFSDRKEVKIVRKRNGASEVAYVNMLDENFLASNYYYIHPGDVVVIAPLKAKAFRNYGLKDISTTFQLLTAAVSIVALIKSLN
ncbi:polysaccharide biosynthesis/export family protein [Fulvitalea axinellae]|uniref:polysaccharide biosynthesis/export family protein n=1 Tax=Fulvitalea axinellae TaxID=1182444 RepID=UPI0030CA5B40